MVSVVALGVLLNGGAGPAGAADNNRIVVTISDTGFSDRDVRAQVGDILVFQLDTTGTRNHTVTFDGGQLEVDFSRDLDRNSWELPPLKNTGKATFYDRYNIRRQDRAAFIGTLVVEKAPDPTPPSTSTSSTSTSSTSTSSTTVTTTPASSTTTTVQPSTTTSAPSAVRPFVIPDPPATTTTTVEAAPTPRDAGPVASPGNGGQAKDKGKGKGKAASAGSPTTVTPARPDELPSELIFDSDTLTPGPVDLFDLPADDDSTDEAALDAAAVVNLLDPPTGDGDHSGVTLSVLGALALVLVAGGIWRWYHRSSRYFPA